MTTVLVTGANGFIGSNLCGHLDGHPGVDRVLTSTREDTPDSLERKLALAEVVFHLAGSNRPDDPREFVEVNVGLTRTIVRLLRERDRRPLVVLASSIQAARDNDYGRSKLGAEEAVEAYVHDDGGAAAIYRLPNVFGKWSRPRYNSVVATFCHSIARDREIEIHDPEARLPLVHVGDVVARFLTHVGERPGPGLRRPEVSPVYEVSVGELARLVRSFRDIRDTLLLPDMSDRLTRLLYGTYLSFLPEDGLAYEPERWTDDRGTLTELLKSDHFGQIFISTTRPGVTRGEHFHHAKAEKFCVLKGEAVIRFRRVGGDGVLEYPVSGDRVTVVDIPPGYTHHIENVGGDEMIVLFWADEVFDPERPDTHPLPVDP